MKILLKCCTQYVSKFRKHSSVHWTGKGQFSFQSQRRAVPKNAQIIGQLYSFPMLVRLCSKSFNLGFNSTWTENFHRYKLDLEKAEEPEIKCQQPENHRKKQGNSRKTSTSVSLTTLKPLTVWITTNCGKFFKIWEYQTTYLSLEKPICRSRSNT